MAIDTICGPKAPGWVLFQKIIVIIRIPRRFGEFGSEDVLNNASMNLRVPLAITVAKEAHQQSILFDLHGGADVTQHIYRPSFIRRSDFLFDSFEYLGQ